MNGLKDIAKGGWHPKGKEGGKESYRGDFKGINQVAGWMGKGKDTSKKEGDKADHYSMPISSLKDPSAFGPPPKNVNYHGGAALPNQITPDTGGLGGPLSWQDIQAKKAADEEEVRRQAEEEAKATAKPPVPYRADRTGLSTSHLPPPPARKDGADGRSSMGSKPPSLPPRLPPRQPSSSSQLQDPSTDADVQKGRLNQGAMDRLSQAGVSVPAFGIGGKKAALPPPASRSTSSLPIEQSTQQNSQINELQSRFSRLASPRPQSDAPVKGTTMEQKQSALKTAAAFNKDPSSVSLSDARSAATTANNFRERHGEQVKTGFQKANAFSQKYGLAERVSSFKGKTNESPPAGAVSETTTGSSVGTAGRVGIVGKAKPPPPPKKRAELSGTATSSPPPPLNLLSKPKPPVSE